MCTEENSRLNVTFSTQKNPDVGCCCKIQEAAGESGAEPGNLECGFGKGGLPPPGDSPLNPIQPGIRPEAKMRIRQGAESGE
jgi:hypothetical protein